MMPAKKTTKKATGDGGEQQELGAQPASDTATAESPPGGAGGDDDLAMVPAGPQSAAVAAAFAGVDPMDEEALPNAALAQLPVGRLEGLDLGSAGQRFPIADFQDGMPDQGVPHAWVSGLDGQRFGLPFLFRPLHAETWWMDWPRDDAGEPILTPGTRPSFKTRNPRLAVHRWGDDAWRYRVQQVLVLPQGAGVPHVVTFKGGSAATVGKFLQSAQHKVWTAEHAERYGVSAGEVVPAFMQVWQLDTHSKRSTQRAVDYWQHTMAFQGVNLDRQAVLDCARWAAMAEDIGLDMEHDAEAPDASSGTPADEDMPF